MYFYVRYGEKFKQVYGSNSFGNTDNNKMP